MNAPGAASFLYTLSEAFVPGFAKEIPTKARIRVVVRARNFAILSHAIYMSLRPVSHRPYNPPPLISI